jgi:DNA-binding transcriptional MerR regulator
MVLRTKEIGKLYYKIGEVAEIFKVNPSLIRFYENEFDIIKPQRNKKGNRLFTQNDVDNFHTIFHLIKEKGYTLEGAKQQLKSKQSSAPEQVDIVKSLQRIKRFLLEIRSELT